MPIYTEVNNKSRQSTTTTTINEHLSFSVLWPFLSMSVSPSGGGEDGGLYPYDFTGVLFWVSAGREIFSGYFLERFCLSMCLRGGLVILIQNQL